MGAENGMGKVINRHEEHCKNEALLWILTRIMESEEIQIFKIHIEKHTHLNK